MFFFAIIEASHSSVCLLRLFPLSGVHGRILDFQNVLSWASSGVIRSSCMSLLTQSIHLPLGLPLGLLPGTIISTIALTSLLSSILCMCLCLFWLSLLCYSLLASFWYPHSLLCLSVVHQCFSPIQQHQLYCCNKKSPFDLAWECSVSNEVNVVGCSSCHCLPGCYVFVYCL